MEEIFFNQTNFEMIYNLIDDDIHEKFKISINDILSINAREILYESMINVYAHSDNNSLEDLNKKLLMDCIPIIVTNIPKLRKYEEKGVEDLQDRFEETDFQNMENLPEQDLHHQNFDKNLENKLFQNLDKNEKLQDLENETIEKRIVSVDFPQKTIVVQKELDANSGDRNNWLSDKTDSPYEFVVNLGASNTFDGISTHFTFKNVVEINITHVILPSIDKTLDRYPFLYLQIEEVTNIYESTSEHGRRSFVKLLRDKQWNESAVSNISYYVCNTRGTGAFPSIGWKGETPIGSLSQMTIRILSSNGNSLPKVKDVYEIEDIIETNNELIVKSKTFIYNDFIHIGNRIGFKHLISNNDKVNSFLEQNEHIVTNITDNKNIHFEKHIEIYDSVNTYTNYNLNENEINITQGAMMNLSLQTTFGFKISSRIHSLENKTQIV